MSKIANYHFKRLPYPTRLCYPNVEAVQGHGYFQSIIHNPFQIKIVVIENDPRTRFKVVPGKKWYQRIVNECAQILDVPRVAIIDDRNKCIKKYSLERLYALRKSKRYRVVIIDEEKKKKKKKKACKPEKASKQVAVIHNPVETVIPDDFLQLIDSYNGEVIQRVYQQHAYDRPTIVGIAHDVARRSFISDIWNHGVRAINNTINTIANQIYRTVSLVQKIHTDATDFWTREALIAKTRAEVRRTTLASWIYHKCATPLFHHQVQYVVPPVVPSECYADLNADIRTSAMQICGLFTSIRTKSRIAKMKVIKAEDITDDLMKPISNLDFLPKLLSVSLPKETSSRFSTPRPPKVSFGDLVYLVLAPYKEREGWQAGNVATLKTATMVFDSLASTGSVRGSTTYSQSVDVVLAKKMKREDKWVTVQKFSVMRQPGLEVLGPSFIVPVEDASYKFIIITKRKGAESSPILEGEIKVANSLNFHVGQTKTYGRTDILRSFEKSRSELAEKQTEPDIITGGIPLFVEHARSLKCSPIEEIDTNNTTVLVENLYRVPVVQGVPMEQLMRENVAPKSIHVYRAARKLAGDTSMGNDDVVSMRAWDLVQIESGQKLISASYMETGDAFMNYQHSRNKELLTRSKWGLARPSSSMPVGTEKSEEVVSVTLFDLAVKNQDPAVSKNFEVWAAVCSTLDPKSLPSMVVDPSVEKTEFENKSIILKSDTSLSMSDIHQIIVATLVFSMLRRLKPSAVTAALLDRTFTPAQIAARARIAVRLLGFSLDEDTISKVSSYGVPPVDPAFIEKIKL